MRLFFACISCGNFSAACIAYVVAVPCAPAGFFRANRGRSRSANRAGTTMGGIAQIRKIGVWALLAALAGLVSYVAFRAYTSPDMLFNFVNSFYC
jgi:hypothetical protein